MVVVVGTALFTLVVVWEAMVDVNDDDKYMENNATKIDNYKRSVFHDFTVGSTRAIVVDLSEIKSLTGCERKFLNEESLGGLLLCEEGPSVLVITMTKKMTKSNWVEQSSWSI